MDTCRYCGMRAADIPTHYVTCSYLDHALGPVKPPRRKHPDQCAYKSGCDRTRLHGSAYCFNHRNVVHNAKQNERLANKRVGTR